MNFLLRLASPRISFDALATHPAAAGFSQRLSRPAFFAVGALSVALFLCALALLLQRQFVATFLTFATLSLAQVLQHRVWMLRPLAQLPDDCARALELVETRTSCAAVRDSAIAAGRHLMVGDLHQMLGLSQEERRQSELAATAAYLQRYGDGKHDRLSRQATGWRLVGLTSGAMLAAGFLSLLAFLRLSVINAHPVAALAFEVIVLSLIPLVFLAAHQHERLLPVARTLNKAKQVDALLDHPVVGPKLAAAMQDGQTLRALHLQQAQRELAALNNPCKKLHGIEVA